MCSDLTRQTPSRLPPSMEPLPCETVLDGFTRLGVMSLEIDSEGRISTVTPNAAEVAGYSPEQLVNRRLDAYLSLDGFPTLLQQNRPSRLLFTPPDSSPIWMRVLCAPGPDDHCTLMLRRLSERELQADVQRSLQQLFCNIYREIAHQAQPEEILRRTAERLHNYHGFQWAGIRLPSGHWYPEQHSEIEDPADTLAIAEFPILGTQSRYGTLFIRMPALLPVIQRLFVEEFVEDLGQLLEQRQSELRIRYLSFHDELTGLYNRPYFEEELTRLDTVRQLPLSVIMADVNGLKITNDAFGHASGDRLLQTIADILESACRGEDVVARVGGDEFAILLPQTSRETAESVVQRIIVACGQKPADPVPLSISLGVATKESPEQTLREVQHLAEDRMYRRKLEDLDQVRSHIMMTLMQVLLDRGLKRPQQLERLRQWALPVGESLGLVASDLAALSLLAELHDIGKIAIPDEILFKRGSLSASEWEAIQRHPEVGYRIATASPQYASVAQAILSHREWYNGDGYPQGLEGSEIPLLARIIAVVDAFDAMMRDTPYRSALSPEQARRELRDRAGTQFDPAVVDAFLRLLDETRANTDVTPVD